MDKKPTAAWTNKTGETLIVAMPSSRGGNYLVAIKKMDNGKIAIIHRCTATINHNRCWHVKAAYDAYCAWRWWEPTSGSIQIVNKPVMLKPEYIQIPVPEQGLPNEVEEWLYGVSLIS